MPNGTGLPRTRLARLSSLMIAGEKSLECGGRGLDGGPQVDDLGTEYTSSWLPANNAANPRHHTSLQVKGVVRGMEAMDGK